MGAEKNPVIARGLHKYSQGARYSRRQAWKHKTSFKDATFGKGDKKEPKKTSDIGDVNQRWYPTEDELKPVRKTLRTKPKKALKPAKLKKSLTPGKILIILAGRFQGKRAVFLGQLPSGLLLVSGPYKLNGVPLRRVNQVYTLSTSTSVDVSSVVSQIPEKLKTIEGEKEYFMSERAKERKKEFKGKRFNKGDKGERRLFAQGSEKVVKINQEWLKERKADQEKVDGALLAQVESVPMLSEYLKERFTLGNGQVPHRMKF